MQLTSHVIIISIQCHGDETISGYFTKCAVFFLKCEAIQTSLYTTIQLHSHTYTHSHILKHAHISSYILYTVFKIINPKCLKIIFCKHEELSIFNLGNLKNSTWYTGS